MFFIYRSNCLELFMKFVINIMEYRLLSDPLQSEIIITDYKNTEKWIEIKLADYFGIAANIEFMNFQSFMKKIAIDICNPDLKIYNFSKDFMFWKFMKILPKASTKKKCRTIKEYLNNDYNQQKLGQLSEHLVDLFSEYLIYRSDWLDLWSTNKMIDNLDYNYQLWQSEIWRMLLESTEYSFQKFNSWNLYINSKSGKIQNFDYSLLPNRIFIYGCVSIPILYWKILDFLSYYIDIYFWFVDPCVDNYLHDLCIQSNVNIYMNTVLNNNYYSACPNFSQSDFIISDDENQNNYFMLNHSLLHKCGKIEQQNLFLLGKIKNFFEIKSFVVPPEDSILHFLQKDILESKCNYKLYVKNRNFNYIIKNQNDKKPYVFKSKDNSITVHACHNIQREIEILHNNILMMLSEDPTLNPGEIIVLAPNINIYKETIKSIFNNLWDKKVPFKISSNAELHNHPVILSLFKILNIFNSRCTTEEILSLLSISSIASRFKINITELQILQNWVIESGIRWGLDDETMNYFDLPIKNSQNTWFAGFQKILLGYSIKHSTELWNNISPYDYIIEENIPIISKLGEFLNILKKWRNIFSLSYSLKNWVKYIQNIIDDFFDYKNLDAETSKVLFLFKNCCINVIQSGIQSGYVDDVNIIIFRDILQKKLNFKKINCRFLLNSINFCNFSDAFCIPCKVLCLIGMNNNIFPRRQVLCSLNLMLKDIRFGDKNIWEKDCYTFLLSFLIPKKKIYISFIKENNHLNNNINYSSKLIDDLLEYIAQRINFIDNTSNIDSINNIQLARKYLFHEYSCIPFNINNSIINSNNDRKNKKSFDNSYKSVDIINVNAYPNFFLNKLNLINNDKTPNFSINTVSIFDLYNFYMHPVRMWFQNHLGVYFPTNIKKILNDEPFSISKTYRFSLCMKIIDYILYDKDIENLYHEVCASGMFPYGSFGKFFWTQELQQMCILCDRIRPFFSFDKIYDLNISLDFDTINLVGQLHVVQDHGLIRWKPVKCFMKDYFLLWLEHLIYCANGGTGNSKLFGINNFCSFPNLPQSTAKELLYSLISGYCLGINTPLVLLYQSGGTWINCVFDQKSKTISSDELLQQEARYKLIKAWQGHNFCCATESQDPYLRKLIPFNLQEEDIKNIIKFAEHYFLDIMKYRIL